MKLQEKLIQSFKRNPYSILMIVIISLGFLIRIYGINFGKPYLYHIDEWKLVNQAGQLLNIKNLSKEVLLGIGTYPPFFTYILAFAFAVFGVAGLVFGKFSSVAAIVEFYQIDPFTFHLIGRNISVIMGTATIPLIYLIGKHMYNKKVGLIAALFLTFIFIHVRNSHYCTVDIPTTFFVILAFYFMTLILKENRLKNSIWASIFSGFAIATKYNSLFIVVPLGLAHLMTYTIKKFSIKKRLLNKKLIISIVLVCISFMIACPLIIVDAKKYLPTVQDNVASQKKGKVGFDGSGFFSYITGAQREGFSFSSRNSLAGGMGRPLMIISLVSLLFCFYRHKREDLLLLSFPVLLYILHGNMNYKAMRHILPIIPFLSVMGAIGIVEITNKIQKRKEQIADTVLALIVAIIVIPMAIDVVKHDNMLTKKDTRTLTVEWFEENVESGSSVAIEFYHPQLQNINEEFQTIGPKKINNFVDNNHKEYMVYDTNYLKFLWGPDRIVEKDPIQIVSENQIQYLVLDNWTSGRFYTDIAINKYPMLCKQRQEFYTWVNENYEIIKIIENHNNETPGPNIQIYKKL